MFGETSAFYGCVDIASAPTATVTCSLPPGALVSFVPAPAQPSEPGDPLAAFFTMLSDAANLINNEEAAAIDNPDEQEGDGTKESIAALFAPVQVVSQTQTAALAAFVSSTPVAIRNSAPVQTRIVDAGQTADCVMPTPCLVSFEIPRPESAHAVFAIGAAEAAGIDGSPNGFANSAELAVPGQHPSKGDNDLDPESTALPFVESPDVHNTDTLINDVRLAVRSKAAGAPTELIHLNKDDDAGPAAAVAFAVQMQPTIASGDHPISDESAKQRQVAAGWRMPIVPHGTTDTQHGAVAVPAGMFGTAVSDTAANSPAPKVVFHAARSSQQGLTEGNPTPSPPEANSCTEVSGGTAPQPKAISSNVNNGLALHQSQSGNPSEQQRGGVDTNAGSKPRSADTDRDTSDSVTAQPPAPHGTPALNIAGPDLVAVHGAPRSSSVTDSRTIVSAPRDTHADTTASKTEISETNTAVRVPSTREISMRIASAEAPSVDVRVIDRAGTVRVAVRTPDADLAHNLQGGLSDLVQKLNRQGFSAETWSPSDRAGTAATQSSKGDSGGSTGHNGSRDPRDSQQNYNGQHAGGRNRPRWVMELEQRFSDAASE